MYSDDTDDWRTSLCMRIEAKTAFALDRNDFSAGVVASFPASSPLQALGSMVLRAAAGMMRGCCCAPQGRFCCYCVSGAARRRVRAARARGWLCYSVARQTPYQVLVAG